MEPVLVILKCYTYLPNKYMFIDIISELQQVEKDIK